MNCSFTNLGKYGNLCPTKALKKIIKTQAKTNVVETLESVCCATLVVREPQQTTKNIDDK